MRTYTATVAGGHPIHFGGGSRELLMAEIERLAPDKVFIVTDRTVESLHAGDLKEQIPHAFPHEVIVFTEGEENKNLATLEHVAGDLMRAGATPRSLVLNLGGGVVLNMGGLAASMVGRGLRFIQVPTTFAAQWAAVNTARQAIHFTGARDALGVYRAPELAVSDPHYLETEPPDQIAGGMVDYAKYALLTGGESYDRAADALAAAGSGAPAALENTLRAALELALEVHRDDPAEHRAAAMDEYGWTPGRALQLLSDGRLSVAEGVYHGMRLSALVARRRGLMDEAGHRRHEALLARLRIAKPWPRHVRTDHYIFKLHGNNKTSVGELNLMLLEDVGRPAPGLVRVADAEVIAAAEELRAES